MRMAHQIRVLEPGVKADASADVDADAKASEAQASDARASDAPRRDA